MSTKQDYYETGDDTGGQVADLGFQNRVRAQSFEASSSYDIESVELKLYRSGTPGTITVEIKVVDVDEKPTGSALASGTINGNTLTTSSSGEWYEITFASSYSLTSGIKYTIVVSAASSSAYWRNKNGGNGYADGKTATSTNGGSSWIFPNGGNDDSMFRTYSGGGPPTDKYSKKRLVAIGNDTVYYEDI